MLVVEVPFLACPYLYVCTDTNILSRENKVLIILNPLATVWRKTSILLWRSVLFSLIRMVLLLLLHLFSLNQAVDKACACVRACVYVCVRMELLQPLSITLPRPLSCKAEQTPVHDMNSYCLVYWRIYWICIFLHFLFYREMITKGNDHYNGSVLSWLQKSCEKCIWVRSFTHSYKQHKAWKICFIMTNDDKPSRNTSVWIGKSITLAHFRVVLGLCFKARVSAKPFIWKIVLLTCRKEPAKICLRIKFNFNMKSLCTRNRFETRGDRQLGKGYWPIILSRIWKK